jgi:uncharacterized protein YdhG (YjbR/CyaY superfamily)
MATTNFTSVDEYLAGQPAAARRLLTRVRNTIRKALPGVEETISYQIPAYKLNGRTVIYFAGWKEHYSIYPSTRVVVETLGDALSAYEVEKGTIRFPLDRPVPAGLIASIAKLRAQEAGRKRKR